MLRAISKMRWLLRHFAFLGVALAVSCGAKTEPLSEDIVALDPYPECRVEGATRACETICGEGLEVCFDGRWRYCSAELPRPPRLDATVRDFRDEHPDFEEMGVGFEEGLVAFELSSDNKPVYAPSFPSLSTSGADNFNTWYRDSVENTALTTVIELLPSAANPALFTYESDAFFPIDGLGFGNQGRDHNFHFTLEVVTAFRYVGGEVFSFSGDDDLWVFINRRLAIDLGGVHISMTKSIELDALSSLLGLTVGEVYPLHLFFAERHTVNSNFNIATTIAEFELCE
jgi:fibro-slime domain-containing protein